MKPILRKPRHITSQILLAVLLPSVLLSSAITGYYAFNRYQDIEAAERQIGEITSNYLALAAELSIYAGDIQALQALATATLNRATVNGVCFLDSNAEILLQRGVNEHPHCTTELDPLRPTLVADDSNLHFSRPVRSAPVPILDYQTFSAQTAFQGNTIGWVVLSLSRDQMLARVQQMLYTAALVALAGTLTGVLFALRAGAAIGRPVRKLRAHLDQINRVDGKLHFEPQGTEETIVLGERINQLVDSNIQLIRSQQQQIDNATANLVRRNEQLEETRKVLEEALKTKDEFLARMSHELRTPLTTIIGFNRLLCSTTNADQLAEFSRHIEHASTLLHSIIDDILDYSRLKSLQFEMEAIRFNLQDCLEDVVGMHGYEALAKHIELVLLIDSDVPLQLIGDPQRLQQIVNNLLANALKFTTEGEVIVQLSLQSRHPNSVLLLCEVRDSGIGISPANQERLFQPFTQADNAITRKYGGTGLGLAICRSLVERMHGEISLVSSYGHGTTVRFTFAAELPATVDNEDTALPRAGNDLVLAYDANHWSRRALRIALLKWSLNISIHASQDKFTAQLRHTRAQLLILSLCHDEAQTQRIADFLAQIRSHYQGPIILLSPIAALEQRVRSAGLGTARMGFALKPLRRARLLQQCQQLTDPAASDIQGNTAASTQLQGLRLLVAEDHQAIRELLLQILQRHGAEVDTVGDGEQAVSAGARGNYDLLLMDLHMPRLDGISAIRQIRDQGGEMPVICITADITAGERAALTDTGVNSVLLKPIDELRLIESICQLCQRSAPALAATAGQTANREQTPMAKAQLRRQLLQLLQQARQAFSDRDIAGYQATMHDILGLAGLYEKKVLHEMIREIKQQGFALSEHEATHLFAEVELLIR